MDPATLVQRQLDAYNARDLDAILATYADDAEQFEHPSRSWLKAPLNCENASPLDSRNPISTPKFCTER